MNYIAFEIPDLSLVRVAGADAIKVLNGLCTAKLVDLTAGKTTEAMFTDDRGRVLAHGMVALEPAQPVVWIYGQYPDPAKLAAHIDRFIFREDAQPKDVSGLWSGVLIDSDASSGGWAALAEKLSMAVDSDCAALTVGGHEGRLMRLPITAADARLLIVPVAAKSDLAAWLTDLGIDAGNAHEFEDKRIRNFWPIAPHEMNERTLPQELDRNQLAISFTKGCYLGQETVARLDALGDVQKKLCLVELSGSDEMVSGQSLQREDKEVGKLNSVSPLLRDGKRLALATMRRGSMSPDSQFVVAPAGTGVVIAHP